MTYQRRKKFIWECRIEYFSFMLSWNENALQYERSYRSESKRLRKIRLEINIITLYFLKSLKFVNDDVVSLDFREKLLIGARNFADINQKNPKNKLNMRALFMLSLLGLADDQAAVGLPINLMERGTDMAGALMNRFHNYEWQEISKFFPDEN